MNRSMAAKAKKAKEQRVAAIRDKVNESLGQMGSTSKSFDDYLAREMGLRSMPATTKPSIGYVRRSSVRLDIHRWTDAEIASNAAFGKELPKAQRTKRIASGKCRLTVFDGLSYRDVPGSVATTREECQREIYNRVMMEETIHFRYVIQDELKTVPWLYVETE